MNLLKYGDYITEKVLYDLILESKVIYSKKFINYLNKMKSNEIAKKLISLYNNDINVQHNYIDVGDGQDVVSFTPDRKAREIEQEKAGEVYRVTDEERYLTNSSANDRIYELLGYEKKEGVWSPQYGTLGVIVKEVVSPRSGKVYVWFKGIDEWDGQETVLNKEALEPSEGSSTYKIWKTSRNNIKIGRLVRAILTASGEKFTDKEIEDFVNQYKATYDLMANALIRFDVVSGSDIAYWYNSKNYADEEAGTLGNSCMANVDDEYFDIYCENPEVCQLVILFDENGEMVDGGYRSSKIVGRCLLWTDSTGRKLMDRIYTNKDSDVELFKEYGKKNGFWWKKQQDSDNIYTMQNGTESKDSGTIIIKLKKTSFDSYPYLDTFFYLNMRDKYLTNDDDEPRDRSLRSTGGGYDRFA